MEILLFNDRGLAKIWHCKDVNVPFVDKNGTAFRAATWKMRLEQCHKDADLRFGKYQLVISIRSKLRASEISPEEMAEFNLLVERNRKR